RVAALLIEARLRAGLPADAVQLANVDDGPLGRALIEDPRVGLVVLTGAAETAELFRSWRPGLPLLAETSGKNALVVTPSADLDLAAADLVASAFGHAGQKCSAASLGILVGSVARSRRFRDQVLDAARSLVVAWPADPLAEMGPLTEPPGEKLLRGLTTLEAGQRWLLKPERLGERLWRPGVRDGVLPGSEFHQVEYFGPVLGLMSATTLDEAIAWQNGTAFGLTAGLHSLEATEIQAWLDRVEAGNVYVNRSITGAIVRRQPFGGWKRSAVGPGAKAGGPDYLMGFGRWEPAIDADSAPPDVAASDDAWLAAARASDRAALRDHFRPQDPTGLAAEINVLRYRPVPVTVRVEDAPVRDVLREAAAASTARAPATFSFRGEPAPA
ncbi:MAG TPA: aldehyde dehydrogenase family protein, partial [Arachnia sp.]|nr:aldehyde dehydrogenase family protein [Arachnia sp.]